MSDKSDKSDKSQSTKICVTAESDKLDSTVDPRFGRCRYFIIVDINSLDFEAIENQNAEAVGGAGIQSAQLVASKGICAVVTGNMGPNAFQVLSKAGIEVYTGASGSVRNAIEDYNLVG